jgi:hypothetical protein
MNYGMNIVLLEIAQFYISEFSTVGNNDMA